MRKIIILEKRRPNPPSDFDFVNVVTIHETRSGGSNIRNMTRDGSTMESYGSNMPPEHFVERYEARGFNRVERNALCPVCGRLTRFVGPFSDLGESACYFDLFNCDRDDCQKGSFAVGKERP